MQKFIFRKLNLIEPEGANRARGEGDFDGGKWILLKGLY